MVEKEVRNERIAFYLANGLMLLVTAPSLIFTSYLFFIYFGDEMILGGTAKIWSAFATAIIGERTIRLVRCLVRGIRKDIWMRKDIRVI